MTETTDIAPNYEKTYYTKNNSAPYYTKHTHVTVFQSDVTYYEIEDIKYQKQCIGQNTNNNDIYIITTNGKGNGQDIGMTTDKIVSIFQNLGCDFAYQLDGGGSTALIYKGEMKNQFTDNDNTTERPCGDFLYFSYEGINSQSEDIQYINERFGNFKRDLMKNNYYDLSMGILIPDNADLNDYEKNGVYYTTSKAAALQILNTPDFTNKFSYIQNNCHAFKMIVEKVKNGVIIQTLKYESSHGYCFIREKS